MIKQLRKGQARAPESSSILLQVFLVHAGPIFPLFFFFSPPLSHLGRSCLDYQAQETKSSLSKTLEQVLRDSVALPYFIQFMELHRMEHLVRFWLEAESFHSTTWSRIRAHSLNTVKHSSLAEPVSPPLQQHENSTAVPSLADLLNARLEDSGLAKPPSAELNGRALELQTRRLLGQGRFGALEAKDSAVTGNFQDSSKVSLSNTNSPSFALRGTAGKLRRSKCAISCCRLAKEASMMTGLSSSYRRRAITQWLSMCLASYVAEEP